MIAITPGLPDDNITSTSTITWTYAPALSGTGSSCYTASGSFDLALNSSNGCTFALAPSTFTIVDDPLTPSRLGIFDDGFNPPTYAFSGSQLVDLTSTATCPGREDVVAEIHGFLVAYASGSGPFTDPSRLVGASDDDAIQSTWDFGRP